MVNQSSINGQSVVNQWIFPGGGYRPLDPPATLGGPAPLGPLTTGFARYGLCLAGHGP